FESCWRKSLAMFASQLPVLQEDIVSTGGIFALVGPTGVGKTTTIAKLAARYALEHGTEGIALVTTDNYRIGAQEQLRTYGRILGTPVKVANNAEELRNILKGLYDKDLVLIDTAGMSQRDVKLTEQFSMLSEGSILIKSYLVISASSQQQVLDETVHAYKKAFLDGCIITKLDETLSLGGALATILQHKLPISYTSNGQRVPEDLHRASAIELVKSAVKMMNRVRIEMDENVVELAYGGIAANDVS
ncbi:MAG TPA: flagellar biosynthesis protein FlhF, partial [Gammaproteobacteria bacterium]|nr:flagellar biosynthesis protein FlhF [Gammaproteobacteria bacterium]